MTLLVLNTLGGKPTVGDRFKIETNDGRKLPFMYEPHRVHTAFPWRMANPLAPEVANAIATARKRPTHELGEGWFTPYLNSSVVVEGNELKIVLLPMGATSVHSLVEVNLGRIAAIDVGN